MAAGAHRLGHRRPYPLEGDRRGVRVGVGQEQRELVAPEATDEVGRAAVAEAMRAGGHPCTASIGAAAYSRAPSTLDAAIHDADAIMYRAKSAGKDRVVIDALEATA